MSVIDNRAAVRQTTTGMALAAVNSDGTPVAGLQSSIASKPTENRSIYRETPYGLAVVITAAG